MRANAHCACICALTRVTVSHDAFVLLCVVQEAKAKKEAEKKQAKILKEKKAAEDDEEDEEDEEDELGEVGKTRQPKVSASQRTLHVRC